VGVGEKEAVLASGVPSDRLVFEAPQRHQQVHFIRVIGRMSSCTTFE